MSLNHEFTLICTNYYPEEKFVYILASLWWQASPFVAERVSIRGYGKRTRILPIYTNLHD